MVTDPVTGLIELADYITPFAIRVVCDLRVADELAGGPVPVAVLADRVGADAGSLTRVLRALAGKGIFAESADEPGVFGLTPLAQPLRTDHPLSLRAAYPLLRADIQALAGLVDCLRTGAPSFVARHGVDYWTYLAGHPADSRAMDLWMASLNQVHLRTVLPALDWSTVDCVVDVGGGNGAFLAGALARWPGLRGILFDLAHVVGAAGEVLAAAGSGVAGRCQVVAGSFFDPVPAGAGRYVLKTVLPGWPDPEAEAILSNIRAAMRPDSRLVLLEAVIPAGEAFDVAKLVDVYTLALTGGRHRSPAELAALLDRSGLTQVRLAATPTLTVVEAVPR